MSTSYSRPETDRVLGVVINGEARAYPIPVLDWHEIVNDEVGGTPISVTYCPLAASGLVFDTTSVGGSTFGTTGKLYENNLIQYDRTTDSEWVQMLGEAISGERRCEKLPLVPVWDTTLSAWRAMHPDTVVETYDTGYRRSYGTYPYGDFETSTDIFFTTSYDAEREPYSLYHPKAMTTVVWEADDTVFYPFANGEANPVVYGKGNIVLVFHQSHKLATPFRRASPDGAHEALHFTIVDGDFDGFRRVTDTETGTTWDATGLGISGPLAGQQLEAVPSYSAFWYSATSIMPTGAVCQSANCDPEQADASTGETGQLTRFDPEITYEAPWRGWMTAAVIFGCGAGMMLLYSAVKAWNNSRQKPPSPEQQMAARRAVGQAAAGRG